MAHPFGLCKSETLGASKSGHETGEIPPSFGAKILSFKNGCRRRGQEAMMEKPLCHWRIGENLSIR